MGGNLDRDVINSLPTWAKVAVLYGDKFVFNVLLLAALLGWIPSPMTRGQDQTEKVIALLSKHERESTSSFDYNNMLLRTLCKNMVPAQAQPQCEPRYRGYEENR